MEKKKRFFQGYNYERLEGYVEEFKKELGDRFIESYISSNNPQCVIVVEYWEDK